MYIPAGRLFAAAGLASIGFAMAGAVTAPIGTWIEIGLFDVIVELGKLGWPALTMRMVARLALSLSWMIPLWTALIVFCATTGYGRGDGQTRCGKCRYLLRGLTEPRCPECGERF